MRFYVLFHAIFLSVVFSSTELLAKTAQLAPEKLFKKITDAFFSESSIAITVPMLSQQRDSLWSGLCVHRPADDNFYLDATDSYLVIARFLRPGSHSGIKFTTYTKGGIHQGGYGNVNTPQDAIESIRDFPNLHFAQFSKTKGFLMSKTGEFSRPEITGTDFNALKKAKFLGQDTLLYLQFDDDQFISAACYFPEKLRP